MKVALLPFNEQLHQKYISSLPVNDIYDTFSITFLIANPLKPNIFYWVNEEETYYLVKRLRNKRIKLLIPPISKHGKYLYKEAKDLLEKYNLPLFIEDGKISTDLKRKKVDWTNDVVYHINKTEFSLLAGKKYKKYRKVFSKVKDKELSLVTFKDTINMPEKPIDEVISIATKWAPNKYNLAYNMKLIKQLKINKNLQLNIFYIKGEPFAYSIIEKLNRNYYSAIERLHILRTTLDIKLWLHFQDIMSLKSDNEMCLNVGGSTDQAIMNSKLKLKNTVVHKSKYWYIPKGDCKIEFSYTTSRQKLLSLF